MSSSHVIISGTGRAGTTFLVQLLTRLGLDTGFDRHTMEVLPAAQSARMGKDYFPIARAGMETDIRAPGAPYIIKTPFLCDWAEEAIASGKLIKHAIIPVRQFEAAAASRAFVQRESTGSVDQVRKTAGGLWDSDLAINQADVLRQKFTKLVEVLVRHDIPITFLNFPRYVRDPDYLFSKIKFLIGDVGLSSFQATFYETVRPELVHQFTEDDR
jgi:hypothetical protein